MQMFLFNPLPQDIPVPKLFTDPFNYEPCEVVNYASEELMRYISSREEWGRELSMGKMFGVLVCKTPSGELGYLSAFSGNLDGQSTHKHFVPPIFDLQQVGSFFKSEEAKISAINERVKLLNSDKDYSALRVKIEELKSIFCREIADYKQFMAKSKVVRNELRASSPNDETLKSITKESQFQKAELKRMELIHRSKMAELEAQKMDFDNKIAELKALRQMLSQDLQHKIFESYIVRNHQGEQKTMIEIFEESRATPPPSGAGECAAPKLLHYAFTNNLKPIAMGEFWWGDSPKGEVRHHGEFYAACKSKCEPILGYMLRGMRLDPNDLNYSITRDLRVVYRDEWLAVVDKPAGMLSVKGRVDHPSVEDKLCETFPQHPVCKVVHRLDMDTSGILIIAFDAQTHSTMQQQFENREVQKGYLALLDGLVSGDVGDVNIPLSSDFNIRPRQKVDYIDGKSAHTSYRVISTNNNQTRVLLTPHTGRTHQLRLHCAHTDGLGVPIVGDRLYGHPSSRLMLQAIKISFTHPATHQRLTFELEAEF